MVVSPSLDKSGETAQKIMMLHTENSAYKKAYHPNILGRYTEICSYEIYGDAKQIYEKRALGHSFNRAQTYDIGR